MKALIVDGRAGPRWANGGFPGAAEDGFEVETSRWQAQKFKEVMSL